jgi:hypothetical protein
VAIASRPVVRPVGLPDIGIDGRAVDVVVAIRIYIDIATAPDGARPAPQSFGNSGAHAESNPCGKHRANRTRSARPAKWLAAIIVAPGHNRAVPLEPEFIVPQDGHDRQDCESRAEQRWLTAHGAQYRRFARCIWGTICSPAKPICEVALAAGGHFLFVCKPAYRYQWRCDVPLRGDAKAIDVNWPSVEISNDAGAVKPRRWHGPNCSLPTKNSVSIMRTSGDDRRRRH